MAVVIKKAVAGKMVGRKFVRSKNPRRNIAEGFYAGGVFHPIRHSADYDPDRAGEGGGTKRKKKPAAKKKAAKKKTAKLSGLWAKRPAAKKKAAKKKGGRR